MSERTAVSLVYAAIFVVGLPIGFVLHAVGASNQLLSCAAILIVAIAAWTVSGVTIRYADARRRRPD